MRLEDSAGRNERCTFYPETYVRTYSSERFEVIEFLPRNASDADQDIYLLRKLGRPAERV
jgi:hypothetical protein